MIDEKVLAILKKGSMDKKEYEVMFSYYCKNFMNDLFCQVGVDCGGIYYEYVENYRGTGERVTHKIYVLK